MGKRINTATWLEKYQRWQVKVQKDGQRRTFSCSTPGRAGQRECNKKADTWLDDNLDGSIRVSKLYAQFLEDQQARTGTGNYTNNESIGRIWILPKIGFKRMEAVTEQDLQNVLNSAGKKQRSRDTIKNIRGCITAFLKFARKAGATKLHPEDLVIPNHAPSGERTVLTQENIQVLFSSTKTTFFQKECDDWYIHAYRFLAVVGLRPGELCELKRNKQSDNAQVVVHGSYNKYGEHTSGKTKNAIRTFILPNLAQQILTDQVNMLKQNGIVSMYLFPNRSAEQATSRELYKRWQAYQKSNGIDPISLYELRHTFVSLCRRSIPEALIKPVLGHSSKMPSYDTYGHEIDGDADYVAQKIQEIYDELLQK